MLCKVSKLLALGAAVNLPNKWAFIGVLLILSNFCFVSKLLLVFMFVTTKIKFRATFGIVYANYTKYVRLYTVSLIGQLILSKIYLSSEFQLQFSINLR